MIFLNIFVFLTRNPIQHHEQQYNQERSSHTDYWYFHYHLESSRGGQHAALNIYSPLTGLKACQLDTVFGVFAIIKDIQIFVRSAWLLMW